MEFLKELWAFLLARKNYGLSYHYSHAYIGGLLILAQGSVVAPFIYTIF